jgi:hemin uptake protein HemP
MLDHVAQEPAHASPPDRSPTAASTAAQRIDSHRLLAGGRELVIDHAGQEYRLRLTRNDKLILTK